MLLAKIKEAIPVKSDRECEDVARGMDRIRIKKTDIGEYYFEFEDGRCCNIINYKGKLTLQNNEILEELIEKSFKNVPC